MCSAGILLLSMVFVSYGQSRRMNFNGLSYFVDVLGLAQLLKPLLLCGVNENYGCESSCKETCTSKLQICAQVCKFGCTCKDGFVRKSSEQGSPCIKREECKQVTQPPVCGENQEYTTCGSACPATCDDLRFPLPKPAKMCILLCKVGCVCKKGFYRTDDGRCVQPEKCCGSNERYKACGSVCVETCNDKPTKCTKQCVPGCFCGCSDYVRQSNSTGSACIHRDDCPAECADDD
jgi:hypothetical protein